VAREKIFGRFIDHREQYPEEADRYARLLPSLNLVKEFPHGADSIRIYAVPGAP
jgi:hypothetical protein